MSLTHPHRLGINQLLVATSWLLVLLEWIVKSLLLINFFWLIFIVLNLWFQKTFIRGLLTIKITILHELLNVRKKICLTWLNIVVHFLLKWLLINLLLRFWLINGQINFCVLTFKLLLHLLNYHLDNFWSYLEIWSRIVGRW